jgi:hypothetical protein
MVTAALLHERNFTHPDYNWRSNPFMFEAFRVAVLELLDALRPDGKIIPPPQLETEDPFGTIKYKKAEDCGRDATRHLLEALQFFGATTPNETNAAMAALGSEFVSQNLLDVLMRTHYGLADAARDLSVKCYWDPQSEVAKLERDPPR